MSDGNRYCGTCDSLHPIDDQTCVMQISHRLVPSREAMDARARNAEQMTPGTAYAPRGLRMNDDPGHGEAMSVWIVIASCNDDYCEDNHVVGIATSEGRAHHMRIQALQDSYNNIRGATIAVWAGARVSGPFQTDQYSVAMTR